MKTLQWIKDVVLPAYPKVFVSPEREITGLGNIIERRKEATREVYRALRQKEYKQRHRNPLPRKQATKQAR